MADHNFTPGSRVEVASDDEGFKGACYVATILQPLQHNNYLVVYDDLMESENEDAKRLTETVHASHVRPVPPLDRGVEMIKLHDVVDAYHRDGWWTGEVIEIVDGGKFLVYFENPPDELVVNRDDIRLHLDWVHGKWEKPKKQSHIYKMISQGAAVEVTFERDNYNVWHIGNVLHVEGNNKFLVKYKCFGVDDKPEYRTEVIDSQCIRPAPPPVEEQDFDVLHKVEAYYRFCWWTGVIRRIIKDRKYVVLVTHSKVEMECNHFNLRPRLDWIDGKWTTTSLNTKLLAVNNEPFTSNRRKSTPRKLHAEKYCGNTRKKNGAAIHVDKAKISVQEELGASLETPVNKNRKKQMRDVENIEGSRGIKRALNKKRGRLEKSSLEEQIGKDNLMLMTIDKANDDNFMLSCKDYKKLIVAERKVLNHLHRRNELLSIAPNISQVEDQTNATRTNSKIKKLSNEFLPDGHEEIIINNHLTKGQADKTVKKLRKEWLSNGHGEKSKFVENGSQQQGVRTSIPVAEDQANETVVQQMDDHNVEGQLLIDDPLRDINDDQPLLGGALLVADGFATATNGEAHTHKSSAVAAKDVVQFSPPQNNVADIASGELGTPSVFPSCDSLKNEMIPFTKCSPLWKSVESMEIYRKAEHKPHFSPLLKCREETREGLAIGHMVIFSTVVEKTSKLRFSDPSSVIEGYLQTLADLEKDGFEVEPVRARLMVLLAKKENKQKLEAEYKQIEDEITNKVVKKDELGQGIIQMNQKIEELTEKLNEAKSRMVMKEDEISTLRSKQKGISENVLSVIHEFESVASCPL